MTRKKSKSQPAPAPVATEESSRDRFFRVMSEFLEGEMRSRSVLAPLQQPSVTATAMGPVEYDNLDPESKKAVDEFMEELQPDIEKKAAALLTNEIRDKIVRIGNIKKLRELMKKGKKPEIKRKKGCIFLQMGSGEPGDEIEEFMIAST